MMDNEEKKFLHQMASPIAAALLLMDILMEDIQKEPQAQARLNPPLEQLHEVLQKVKSSLEERRKTLMQTPPLGMPKA
ncbi:MAG: hypothetical protein ACO3A2_06285 [Bdellovibrionia bacterium]